LAEITADPLLTSEMSERTQRLSRGIKVHPDAAHSLGLQTFPNLPERLRPIPNVETPTSSRFELIDDSLESADEQKLTVRNRIETITLPSVFHARLTVILIFIFLHIAPLTGVLILADFFAASFESEVRCLAPLSEMRAFALQIPAFAFRAFGEHPIIWKCVVNLGRSWSTQNQLANLAGLSIVSVQRTSTLFIVERHSKRIIEAQTSFFGAKNVYPYYHSPSETTNVPTTISGAFTMIVLQQEAIAVGDDYGLSAINSTMILNAVINAPMIEQDLAETTDLVIADIKEFAEGVSSFGLFLLSTATSLEVIISIALLLIICRRIRAEKRSVYECFVSLPKSTLSALSDALRNSAKGTEIEKEEGHTKEISKRDENVLKILSSGGPSRLELKSFVLQRLPTKS
jgi:hypothetical protein